MKKRAVSSIQTYRICGPLPLVRPAKDDPHSLILAGLYTYVDVEPDRLKPARVIETAAAVEIVSFEGRFDTRTVLAALHAPGGIPAPLEALLMLGIQHPFVQRGWNKSQRGIGGNLYAPFPQNVTPTRGLTDQFWCPKVVCLAEPVTTRVADHSVALGLSFQDSFSSGRNVIAYQHQRVWDGEDFCFPRLLTNAA